MNHYMDLDPAPIRARNERIREEVNSLRLQVWLPKKRNPRISSNTVTSRVLLTVLALSMAAGVLMLALGAQEARAAFPGNNGRIAFASERTTGEGVDNPTGDSEIFTMNPDGTGITQLTKNAAYDSGPSISDDGSVVVFTSERDGNLEIYVMYADGTDQRRVTNNTVTDDYPTISPNGYTVAYRSVRNGNYEIISYTGGSQENLTNNAADDTMPAFSPDGTKIAFSSDRDGKIDIYAMDANGTGAPTNLTNNPAFDYEPSWSPDGKKIAFASDRDNKVDIYAMNALDGSSKKRLTRNAAIDNAPAWSPGGNKLAFMSERGGGDAEIYTMKPRPEGTRNRPNNLTRNSVSDVGPDWGVASP